MLCAASSAAAWHVDCAGWPPPTKQCSWALSWQLHVSLSTTALVCVHAELGQKPDLIIGNYSDGNLVASLLAHRMFVTQCNIAHALEKTKYQDADIKWWVQFWGGGVFIHAGSTMQPCFSELGCTVSLSAHCAGLHP